MSWGMCRDVTSYTIGTSSHQACLQWGHPPEESTEDLYDLQEKGVDEDAGPNFGSRRRVNSIEVKQNVHIIINITINKLFDASLPSVFVWQYYITPLPLP